MQRTLTILISSVGLFLVIGCVPQQDYDMVLSQNRTLRSEKEEAFQRTLDAEAQADALRSQVRSKEGELHVQKSLLDSYQAENQRLQQAFDNAQALLAKIDWNPQRPLVIQTPLPPELDDALRNFASSHPDIEYNSARGVVKWKSDLLFASGSDVVREDAKSTLRSFSEIVNLPAADGFDILVVGHTDADPIVRSAQRHPTNWHLSAHRAIAVGRQLLGARVDPGRLGIVGYSQFRPLSTNDSPASKSLNRRVEVFLVAKGALVSSTATPEGQPAAQEAPQK